MAGASSPNHQKLTMSDQKKPSNLKTALILATIALMFFIGIFVRRIWLG
jgi:hypothetical protein